MACLSTVAPLIATLNHCSICNHFDCSCPASSALTSSAGGPTKLNAAAIARAHRKRIRLWLDQVSASFAQSSSPQPKPGVLPEPSIKDSISLITHNAVSHAIPNICRRENEAVRARSRSRGRNKSSGADQRRRSKSAGVPANVGRAVNGAGANFEIDCGYDTEPKPHSHHHHHHHHHQDHQQDPLPEQARLISPTRTSAQPLQQPTPLAPSRQAKILTNEVFLAPPHPRYAASESAASLTTADSSAVPASTAPTTVFRYQSPVEPAVIRTADIDLRAEQVKQFHAVQLKHMELAQAKEDIMQDAIRKAGLPVGSQDVIMTEQERERERNQKALARNQARNDQFKRAREARLAAIAKSQAGGA